MTRKAALTPGEVQQLHDHEYVRERIVEIGMACEPGVLQFTGDGETPGCVYRDGDVTVVWMGGLKCVAVPTSGPSLTISLAEDGEDLPDLIERICEEADLIMRTAADAYRIRLHQRNIQGY